MLVPAPVQLIKNVVSYVVQAWARDFQIHPCGGAVDRAKRPTQDTGQVDNTEVFKRFHRGSPLYS